MPSPDSYFFTTIFLFFWIFGDIFSIDQRPGWTDELPEIIDKPTNSLPANV